jgi:hypothetical protein
MTFGFWTDSGQQSRGQKTLNLFYLLYILTLTYSVGFLLLFPMCSHELPQDVPNNTSVLIPIWFAQSSMSTFVFYFATKGPKRYFNLGVPNVPKNLVEKANQCGSSHPKKKKEKKGCEHAQELINMNHTYLRSSINNLHLFGTFSSSFFPSP